VTAFDEDELAGKWGQPLPRRDLEPPTGFPSLAAQPVFTADDRLVVLALLRCEQHRKVIASVLHLDRTRRQLPPLLLAELCREEHGDWVSRTSSQGAVLSSGARLAEIDWVPIGAGDWPDGHRFRLDCAAVVKVAHEVTPGELQEAGRRGYRRMRDTPSGRAPRPLTVLHGRVVAAFGPRETRTERCTNLAGTPL